MKNYQKSDYALNKYAMGIVYRFANETIEVTQEQYLCENPDETIEDFLALKELSDSMYLQQDRDDNAKTKKNVSIERIEELLTFRGTSLEEQYIEACEKREAKNVVAFVCESAVLTKVQRRRFILHFIEALSYRQIAAREGVTYHAVALSIQYALNKIKKFLE